MPYAVTLPLDPATAGVIEGMWRALAASGLDDGCVRLGYVPHITLAVYSDDAPADTLRTTLERATVGWTALPVTLAGFGVFPSQPSVLWAAPVVTSALLDRHAAVVAALPGPHPHHRPGAWVPHVTLSNALHDPAGALAAVLSLWRPLAGVLDRLELVRFHPVEVLWSRSLPAGR